MLSSFVKKLRHESARWVQEGLVEQGTRQRILERYHEQEELEQKAGSSRLISTLSVMGAVMVGLGLILFVASNWSGMTKPAKVVIILSAMLISYASGWWLRHERASYPKVGAALMLLGSIAYGAGIFLIAQAYNVSVHYPNGLLFWWLGVLPMAYLLGLRPMLVLSIATMLVWLGSEAGFRIHSGQLFKHVALYLMCGLLMWELGLVHRLWDKGKSFGFVYTASGLLVVFVTLFLATFDDFFRLYSWRADKVFAPDTIAPFYWAMGLAFIALILYRVVRTLGQQGREARAGAAEVPVMMLLLVLAAYFGLLFGGVKEEQAMSYALASNLLYAFFIVGMIVIGYFKRMLTYINIGLAFFAIDITARYFDYFWKLLPRSIFFVIGGLMLILGGVVLERQRRRVLGAISSDEAGA